MKKILLSALVALSAQSIWADEYNYLTVAYNSVEQSIALGTVKKITFQGGNCVVSTTEGEFSYPLSQMEKMRFTADPTAIERLPLQAEGRVHPRQQPLGRRFLVSAGSVDLPGEEESPEPQALQRRPQLPAVDQSPAPVLWNR